VDKVVKRNITIKEAVKLVRKCVECEAEISSARLKAVPSAVRCVGCQNNYTQDGRVSPVGYFTGDQLYTRAIRNAEKNRAIGSTFTYGGHE
jgi:hypothetical protein